VKGIAILGAEVRLDQHMAGGRAKLRVSRGSNEIGIKEHEAGVSVNWRCSAVGADRPPEPVTLKMVKRISDIRRRRAPVRGDVPVGFEPCDEVGPKR
jgi:hypothetical protein